MCRPASCTTSCTLLSSTPASCTAVDTSLSGGPATQVGLSYCISSVPDPNPEPDPRVFWPPGSGSTSMDPDPSIIMQKYKKNFESYYFVTLFDFLSVKNNVNIPSKSTVTSRKNCVKKLVFCWNLEGQ